MFTGIVEKIGTVKRVARRTDCSEILIDLGELSVGLRIGASVAVSGVCLTLTALDGECGSFAAVLETLRRTTLGDLTQGSPVNLERALAANGRFDGHIVQGHVDAVAVVARVERRGADVRIDFDCPVAGELVPKGSVAVDGVSLTVVERDAGRFSVAAIPHTLAATTLGRIGPGDRVNVETDVVGRYVRAGLENMLRENKSVLTEDFLRRHGFA